jgi:site-specific recombinase XerD
MPFTGRTKQMKKIKDPELFAGIKKFLTVYMPQIRNKSVNTVASYKFTLSLYLTFLQETKKKSLAEITVADFNQNDILLYMDWLKSKRENEVTTVNQRLSNIRTFCSFLNKNGLISHSDMHGVAEIKKLPDMRKKELPFLSVEDVKLILSQPDTGKKNGVRDKFFIALLYDSGCRDQEILDLRVKDVVIGRGDEAELRIIGKGGKYRVTPVSKGVINLFHDYCKIYHPSNSEINDRHLFYTVRCGIMSKMSPDNVQRFLKGYGQSAMKANTNLIHLYPHLFRHTRAMHLYMAGVPLPLVSEWLGHSNMETTHIYAQASIDMKRKAVEKLAESDESVFSGDVTFKYANDDDVIKRLSGLQ